MPFYPDSKNSIQNKQLQAHCCASPKKPYEITQSHAAFSREMRKLLRGLVFNPKG
ncbi:MAG: hypothetical protein ACI8TX_001052 [Hyphomicrobiaceae bacterium]